MTGHYVRLGFGQYLGDGAYLPLGKCKTAGPWITPSGQPVARSR